MTGEESPPSRPWTTGTRMRWSLGLLFLTLVVRLVPAWALQAEAADIGAYHDLGRSVLRGDNIYALGLFHYSPYSQFLLAWAVRIADATGWQFDFVVKLPSILSDCGTSLLLFAVLAQGGATRKSALFWSLAWALNPVAILSSAFHGNMMEILPVLILAAYYVFEAASRSDDRDLLLPLSALLLGIAIAVRPYPILLLPIFLFFARAREIPLFAFLALLPSALSSLPYFLHARQVFLREVLGYKGMTDFGWAAVIRAASYALHDKKMFSFDQLAVSDSQRLFLAAYVFFLLTLPFFRTSSLGRALLCPPLLFLALYASVSAQYLIWVLPIALALRDRLSLLYTAAAAAAMVFFYSIYQHEVLYGRFPSLLPDNRAVALGNALANVALVAISCYWVFRILREEIGAFLTRSEISFLARRLSPRFLRIYAGFVSLCLGAWLIQFVLMARRVWHVAAVTLS
jgi:hypothetical protein